MLHDIGAAQAADVIRDLPLVMAELVAASPVLVVPAAPEPTRVIIEVRHQEPRYPWQGPPDIDTAAPLLIPPPPSVTALPAFSSAASASLAEMSPEQVVARREP